MPSFRHLLIFAVIFLPPGLCAGTICDPVMGRLVSFNPDTIESVGGYDSDWLERRNLEAERTFPAVKTVVHRYREKGIPLPPRNPSNDWKGDVTKLINLKNLPTYGTKAVPITEQYTDRPGTTYILWNNEKLLIRKIEDEKTRLRYLAASLNEAMGLDTVPRSHFASVNGQICLVSKEAPGKLPFDYDVPPKEAFDQALARGDLKLKSYYDAWAFEFLVSNADVAYGNFHYDGKGNLRVFDHGLAFRAVLLAHDRTKLREYFLGRSLPPQYTKTFVDAIQALTPEKIKEKWGGFLTEGELAGLLFRREVILADLAKRGDPAVYQP